MIEAKDWGWRYAGRERPAVANLSFTINDGERVLLLGASGAGKSTLLAALAGVLGGADEGTESGTLLVNGKHPTRMRGHVGLVLQDPDSQIILSRVGDEIAFGCENLGVDPDDIWRRVPEALEAVRLRVPLDRSTSALSGGQKQRMAIAAALAMQAGQGPGVLCLDEPTANLDHEGIADVRDAIDSALSADTTLVVVEHRVEAWAGLIDRLIVIGPDGVIADGPFEETLRAQSATLLDAGVWVPGHDTGVTARQQPASRDVVLESRDLAIGYGSAVATGLNVGFPQGLSTVIVGPNGAGKSTLALTMAGLLCPLGGEIIATPELQPRPQSPDPHRWKSRELLTRIGTVFQQPEHQFVENSVRDELAVGLRALKRDTAAIRTATDELLETLHLAHVADANPFTLSGGEQRRLSVATVLATSPRVVILDEPTFGQDRNTWIEIVRLTQRILDQGRSVVSVTHDAEYLRVLGEHTIEMEARHDA